MPVDVLEHVLGALHEGVLVVDAAGRRVYANDEAARLTGYPSVEALLDAPVEEAAARFEIRDRSGRPLQPTELPGRRALAGEEGQAMLVRFRSDGGPERVSEVRTATIPGADGTRAYVVTFFREVTQQVAEADQVEALYIHAQQTTALLDALYGSAPVGLGFWDRDLRYVRVDEALARINERPAEDHVGRTFREVVPQLADDLEAIARGVLETGEAVIGLQIAAGTPTTPNVLRHWSASYYPVLGPDGEAIGVGAVIEETTERRRAEQLAELHHAVTSILSGSGSVGFYVSYRGNPSWESLKNTGQLQGQGSAWTLSAPVSMQPYSASGWLIAQITLVGGGAAKSDAQLYNLYIDPYRR